MRRLLVMAALVALSATSAPAASSLPLTAPRGFTIAVIAHVPQARELAVAPNGDLFVGTLGDAVYVIPHPDGEPGTPRVFVRMSDRPANGIAFGPDALFVGTQFGVWKVPYKDGDEKANGAPHHIATVRSSGISGRHVTTTLAFSRGTLYAGIGSSCDACDPEVDKTRAS
ncbi:MAG: hypothetical protein JO101_06705, partial [Candidatus Eremiobacteraeota bacterium]|nr:hypothetical protein [Candidatus Eremiobacteraeota bacterium]